MFTIRLRNVQHPSEAEKLLEAYVADSGILPKDALHASGPNCPRNS